MVFVRRQGPPGWSRSPAAGRAKAAAGAARVAAKAGMAKPRTVSTCSECGAASPKWLGKCPGCGAWNSLVEGVAEAPAPHRYAQGLVKAQPVATLSQIEAAEVDREPTGQAELDRVLGGGLVAGGVVLIGGDPGIGKSTLLLQALDAMSRRLRTLYVTGEESGEIGRASCRERV